MPDCIRATAIAAKTRAEWREAKLRKQVRELRGRLQRYGADVEARACAFLSCRLLLSRRPTL
eukprot:6200460-Pleurochrysis_carterae.AAC.1